MACLVEESVTAALDCINILRNPYRKIILKREQEIVVKDMLGGRDVLAVLPTGFGKSMIYTVFAVAKGEFLKRSGARTTTTCVLVISPLKSIINDQIEELKYHNFTAEELSDRTLASVVAKPPQFLFATAEEALGIKFLDCLKDSTCDLHETLAAVVVDEAHTVESWTGKR